MNALRLQHLEGRRKQNEVCGNCGQLSHCLPDNIDCASSHAAGDIQVARLRQSGHRSAGRYEPQVCGGGRRMKILHVTPHLGGGVGKAHAALSAVLPEIVQQTFVLLEAPRDRRYVEMIETAGARVIDRGAISITLPPWRAKPTSSSSNSGIIRAFSNAWRGAEFPAMRSVFWSHISGIARPLIQPALMAEAAAFRLHDRSVARFGIGRGLASEDAQEGFGDQQRLRLPGCTAADARAGGCRASPISARSTS